MLLELKYRIKPTKENTDVRTKFLYIDEWRLTERLSYTYCNDSITLRDKKNIIKKRKKNRWTTIEDKKVDLIDNKTKLLYITQVIIEKVDETLNNYRWT